MKKSFKKKFRLRAEAVRRQIVREKFRDVAAKARANNRVNGKNKSSNPDVELRRAYYDYQDLKDVFVGVNTVLAWVDDFVVGTDLKDYLQHRLHNYTLTADPTKEMLASFDEESRKIKIRTKKPEKGEWKTEKEKIENSSVLVKLEAPKYEFTFNPLRSIGYSYHRDAAETEKMKREALAKYKADIENVDKQIGALFKSMKKSGKDDKGGNTPFKFPRFVKMIETEIGSRSIVLNVKPVSTSMISFADFATSSSGRGGTESFTKTINKETGVGIEMTDENMPSESYRKMLEFQLHIDEDSFIIAIAPAIINQLINDEVLGAKLKAGTLTLEELATFHPGNFPTITFSPKMDLYIRYPMKYAMWATCAKTLAEFNPPMFVDKHNISVSYATSLTKGTKVPTKVSGMNLVRDEVRQFEKIFKDGKEYPARTNEDGFAITKSAGVLWLPRTDNTDDYMAKMKSRYDKTTGEILQPVSVGLANYPVYTDWKNNKFSYCDAAGHLSIIDIAGCSPMTSSYIFRELDRKLSEAGDDQNQPFARKFLFEYSNMLDPSQVIFSEVMKEMTAKYGQAFSAAGNVLDMFKLLTQRATVSRLTYADIFGPIPEEGLEGISRKDNPSVYFMIDVIKGTVRKLREVLETKEHKISISNDVRFARFGAFLLTKYAENFDSISQEHMDQRKRNKLADIPEATWEKFVPTLPNMPGLEFLMPHQLKVVGGLQINKPVRALIDVGAGGGKTIISIADILNVLQEKMAKRALIITKDNLVKEFASEIERQSQGNINAVCITTATIEAHTNFVNSMGGDFDAVAFVKWIKSYPINTIFITGFNFVKKSDWSKNELAMFRNFEGGAIRSRNELVYGNYTGPKFYDKSSSGRKTTAFRPMQTFPMADMLVLCEFDYVAVDEAHYIKEVTSGVTQAVNNVLAPAKIRRWMSGTLVTDKARDLVGITSTTGSLGDDEYFKKRFMEGLKLKRGDETAKEIFELIGDQYAVTTQRRKEWAFIMPYIRENIHPAPMTPLQESFYKKLLEMQSAEFQKQYEEMLKKRGGKPSEDGEEDEVFSAKIEELMRTTLYRLEIFMGAPDEDDPKNATAEGAGYEALEAFPNLVPKPGPEDLVSPKVKIINKILDSHFNGAPYPGNKVMKDESPRNKVLILSYNKPLSRHIMKHLSPQFRAMAVRYTPSPTAKDRNEKLLSAEQALEQFKNNPKIKIMVADQASMQEGHNLQIASRLIEVQSIWSPGRMEQARARVARPSPKGDDREFINIDIVAGVSTSADTASVDYAKFARMVTKIVTKAQLDYAKDPSWQNDMARRFGDRGDLKLPDGGFKMSPEAIAELTPDKLEIYFHVYKAFIAWEQDQFRKVRASLKRKLQDKYPDQEITDEDVKRLAMVKVQHAENMPGSRRAFSPYVTGQQIFDPLGLNLQSIVQSDSEGADGDDDDDENGGKNLSAEKTLIEVDVGTPVWTAYGPGRVRTLFVDKVRVDVPGLGMVAIPKGAAFVSKDQEGLRKFERLLTILGEAGAPTIDKLGRIIPPKNLTQYDLNSNIPIKRTKVKPVVEEELEDEDDENVLERTQDAEEPGETHEVTIYPLVLNGSRALVYVDSTEDRKQRDYFLSDFGKRAWNRVPDFIRIHITNHLVLDDWIGEDGALVEKYSIKPERLDYIRQTIEQMRSKSKTLIVDDTAANSVRAFQNFWQLSHKDLPKNQKGEQRTVRPWLATFGGAAYLCFDVDSHHPTLLQELNRLYTSIKKKRASVKAPQLTDSWAVKFVGGVAVAKQEINVIAEHRNYDVNDYDEVIEETKKLGVVKSKPVAKKKSPPVGKAAKPPAKGAGKVKPSGKMGSGKAKPKSSGKMGGKSKTSEKIKKAVKAAKPTGRMTGKR